MDSTERRNEVDLDTQPLEYLVFGKFINPHAIVTDRTGQKDYKWCTVDMLVENLDVDEVEEAVQEWESKVVAHREFLFQGVREAAPDVSGEGASSEDV